MLDRRLSFLSQPDRPGRAGRTKRVDRGVRFGARTDPSTVLTRSRVTTLQASGVDLRDFALCGRRRSLVNGGSLTSATALSTVFTSRPARTQAVTYIASV